MGLHGSQRYSLSNETRYHQWAFQRSNRDPPSRRSGFAVVDLTSAKIQRDTAWLKFFPAHAQRLFIKRTGPFKIGDRQNKMIDVAELNRHYGKGLLPSTKTSGFQGDTIGAFVAFGAADTVTAVCTVGLFTVIFFTVFCVTTAFTIGCGYGCVV